MRNAVIVDTVRTPCGRRDGMLKDLHPADLAAHVFKAIEARSDIDPAIIDDVIMGCVAQVGQQALNIGRSAVLAAGWPESKAFMLLGEAGNPDAPAKGEDPIAHINSFDDMLRELLNIFPPEVQAIQNFQGVDRAGRLEIERESVPGTIATSDVLTEGFEIDLVANPTYNWRIMLNVAKQEAAGPTSQRVALFKAKIFLSSAFWILR